MARRIGVTAEKHRRNQSSGNMAKQRIGGSVISWRRRVALAQRGRAAYGRKSDSSALALEMA